MLRQRAGAELAEVQRRRLHQQRRGGLRAALVRRGTAPRLAAAIFDLAVQVVEEGLPDALNREDWLTLERWLRMMPATLVESRPWLLILRAWIMQFTWQLGAQLRVL